MARIAINGFGRIGRTFVRCAADSDLDIVAINDVADPANLAYLLKYDTVYGRFDDVALEGNTMRIGKWSARMTQERDPANLPWRELDIDVVVESSGFFLDRAGAGKHLQSGAKKVVLSAPAKGDGADVTVVLGVNWDTYDADKHRIISNASCTTNCAATMAKVLNDAFGIEWAFMMTAHAYTASQKLVDGPEKKWRRGRAAAQSIVPASTGAAEAVSLVIPELKGKMHAAALRVPVVCGSLLEIVCQTARPASMESVNDAFTRASNAGKLKGLLTVTGDELVSSDIIGDASSAKVDLKSTRALGQNLVQVFGWYDNEWGYCCRLRDVTAKVAERIFAPAL